MCDLLMCQTSTPVNWSQTREIKHQSNEVNLQGIVQNTQTKINVEKENDFQMYFTKKPIRDVLIVHIVNCYLIDTGDLMDY